MLQDSRNSRSNSSRCWSRTKPFPDGSTIGNWGHYQQRPVSRQYPHPLMQRPLAESDDVLKLLEMEFFSDRRNRDLMFNKNKGEYLSNTRAEKIGNLGNYQQRPVSRQYPHHPHPLMQRPPAESDDVLKLLEMEFFSDRRNRDLMFNCMFNGTKIQYSEFGGERALYRPSRVLFVSKIESGGKPLSEDNLFSIFSKHGKVEKAYVSVDKTGHSFYGIVQMSSLEEAKNAIKYVDDAMNFGRRIRVTYSNKQPILIEGDSSSQFLWKTKQPKPEMVTYSNKQPIPIPMEGDASNKFLWKAKQPKPEMKKPAYSPPMNDLMLALKNHIGNDAFSKLEKQTK